MPDAKTLELAKKLLLSALSQDSLPRSELTEIVGLVHSLLLSATAAQPAPASKSAKRPDKLIPAQGAPDEHGISCMECGKSFKSLKLHLSSRHNLSPNTYRSKWALPEDYPMVTPEYAQRRSEIARTMKLGKDQKKSRRFQRQHAEA